LEEKSTKLEGVFKLRKELFSSRDCNLIVNFFGKFIPTKIGKFQYLYRYIYTPVLGFKRI
jgi:hypothetical protein